MKRVSSDKLHFSAHPDNVKNMVDMTDDLSLINKMISLALNLRFAATNDTAPIISSVTSAVSLRPRPENPYVYPEIEHFSASKKSKWEIDSLNLNYGNQHGDPNKEKRYKTFSSKNPGEHLAGEHYTATADEYFDMKTVRTEITRRGGLPDADIKVQEPAVGSDPSAVEPPFTLVKNSKTGATS